ncbi:MAG: DUF5011 domain-containing protein [Ruminococcaceae bacterium]|nr:DUF5011 domain-containing protein [Oscillospiraceae bacterium]
MSEDILNKEEALNRRRERMRKRQSAQLHKRIVLLIGFMCLVLGMLIATSFWVLDSYTTPLELPDSISVQQLTVSDQENLRASDFVQGLENTGISVTFGADYDAQQLGEQTFTLVFTRGHEVCTRTAKLYRFHIETFLRVPLGQENTVTARSFVPDETIEAQLGTSLQEGAGGAFTLMLFCNGKNYEVECIVEENIPPTGTGKELTVEADTCPDPKDFVENLQDNSSVTVTYKTPQEFIRMGKNKVQLLLVDYFGNTTELEATANVVPAADGPRFTGLEPVYLELGAAISYKAGVKATDPQDGELTFTVDAGDFDSKVEGKYTVAYSATDSDGHRITVLRTVIVESHLAQLVREKAQQVLNSIIKPDMSRDQQIRKIFEYVKWNTYYVGNSDKSSLEAGAYEGFTKGSGDCYTYYAMVRVLLDMLEIPNVECRRVGSTSNHWWNLVQFADGKYYHVDASPHAVTWIEHFKMTESTVTTYTQNPDVMAYRPNYYVYDHTLPQYQGIEIAQ